MNVHNKPQFTHAMIKCVPKYSSCDTPLTNTLKLEILVSNENSRSTKVFEWPYTKHDSILTHNGLPVFCNKHLFQLTQYQKGLFQGV
ncbi:hypothetical protein H5410_036370 [Solanum commersonii]|uniref:Uncharacterized protein n=1 Tax=Solanum commersonii TaxID=4109 RepID=A0A9J5Y550_SOLCO|nr:hypothetical protein H5410_036370 [Solanum commersonii]